MEQTTLQLPLISLTKTAITGEVENWLNGALESHPADELYILLKQMEFAVEEAMERLKKAAFNSAGERFKGEAKGEILGHGVKLVGSSEWVYSAALQEFVERQKKELKVEQLKEQANGTAKKIEKDSQIRISLKE